MIEESDPRDVDEEPDDDKDVYALDLDDENEDAEEVLREALAAVDAQRREQNPHSDDPAASGHGQDEIERLRQENEALREKALRHLADYENFRRRTEREREEIQRYAGSEILREFLAVVDNLERALAAGGSPDDLRAGVEMIHRQMLELLRRFGVEPVEAAGESFDPSVHEAVSRQEDPAVEDATVVDEMQRGYRHHDRLLRPAIVTVAVPPEDDSDGSGGQG
jgi:molecular chaperone GrpE